jgi:indole-3-glycerol phosphate synthase
MNVLQRIFAAKVDEVADARARIPLAELISRGRDLEPARPFARALAESPHPLALVAEVKKASPVKGVIRDAFDPEAIARGYERAGADCLSVLTDVAYFQGSPEHLIACRAATALPVLRKDFLIDDYQVWEARAWGADAVLLIVSGLDDGRLRGLRELAEELGMDALVETHTEHEMERAIASGARLVGINNRDLATFETRLDITERLAPLAGDALLVSESALDSPEATERVRAAGARAALIGTAFCREPDVEAAVRRIMGWR